VADDDIRLSVNGAAHASARGDPSRVLADYLRDDLGRTDVKVGCREGACGACTVLLDGQAVPSCLVFLARADGAQVMTPATVASTELGARIAGTLVRRNALQCGFCTPGIVTAIYAMLAGGEHQAISADDLRGHLCRCTGYLPILAACAELAGTEPAAPDECAGVGRGIDGAAKATGQAPYVADAARLAGAAGLADAARRPVLYGAVLTCQGPHSEVRVDLAGLRALPGVVVALDHAATVHWPAYSANPHGGRADTRVFAGVGRFPGDVVGAIAATDRASLHRALARAGEFVRERPLPAVLSLAEALRLGQSRVIADARVGAAPDEVRAALAGSPRVLTSTTRFDPSPHGFLERLAAGAELDHEADRWRVWSPSQCPALARAVLTGLTGRDVAIEPAFLGGGFGGKEEITLEPAAIALSAAASGARVLVEASRRHMTGGYRSRHGGWITVTTGYDDDGVFLAREVDVVFEAGPYDGHSSTVAGNAASVACRLYPRGTVGARARAIGTNRLPGGAFRGYGAIQATYAVETHVDEIAAELRMDPVEIRRRNVARDGDTDPVTGTSMRGIRGAECLDLLATRLRESGALDAGVALLVSTSAAAGPGEPDAAEAACRLDPATGQVVVETTAAEAGQGTYPLLARIAARCLGVSGRPRTEDLIRIEHVAAAGSPYDPGMFGSRGANVTGSAVASAAAALRAAVVEVSAKALSVSHEEIDVDFDAGLARAGGREVKLGDLGAVRVMGRYSTEDPGLAFGAQAAEVDCDARTGQVRVRRIAAVHDAGTVLDAEGARAQVVGGVVQAVGAALSEVATFGADGAVSEAGFVSHLVPTAVGLPEITVEFLAAPEPGAGRGAGTATGATTGAKGVGEAAVMGGAAAIANAVARVTGVRTREVPLTPERVLRALEGC
jgi:CO/xanthine dehydrogenase Mo-binding subunit/aerobic-type carbon monoxide dehydrogenase small subunit (CoxS/CutS family)